MRSLITALQDFKISKQPQKPKDYQIRQNNNSDLGEKHKKVFEFIRINPNIHQEGVVEAFKGKLGFSRTVVLNLIKALVKDHYIISNKKDKRHAYSLCVNESNVLLVVEKEIDGFKKQFFILLQQLKKIIDNIENERKKVSNNDTNNKILEHSGNDIKKMLSFLHQSIYEKFIFTCMFRAIFAWSNKIKDEQTLYKLCQFIISNIMEIQLKYYKFGNTEHVSLPSIYFANDICALEDNEDEIQVFKSNGLEKETRSVLRELGKINYRYSSLNKLMRGISV
jgi:predicted transcriptional regulator